MKSLLYTLIIIGSFFSLIHGQEPAANASGEAASEKEAYVNLGGLNLVDMEMKKLLPKIAQWTGKVVIPDSNINRVKLTIYSNGKHTKEQILKLIYAALEQKGYVVEERADMIFIKEINDSKLGLIPTIPDDIPLASIEDKTKMVQKIFKLQVYSPREMESLLKSLTEGNQNAQVIADSNTNNLIVIDTVSSLIQVESIINELDVPEADQTISETISIENGDANEIVQLLEILLRTDTASRSRNRNRGGPSNTFIGPSMNPVVLIPMPAQGWIIARAAADDMEQIKEWVAKLDLDETDEVEQEMVSVQYLDVNELARRLNDGIRDRPGAGLKPDVLIQPLEKAKKILIFGSANNRARIKNFIAQMDVPSEKHITEKFELEYADPDTIQEYIENLFQEQQDSNSRWSNWSRRNRDEDFVRVVSNPILKQVTVIAIPENMAQIREQIKEWDQPLDLDDVKPLIITLKNSDPVKFVKLLSTLFSEDSGNSSSSFFNYWYGGRGGQDKEKIVGALYGQLTFEAVPDTKKVIVISKIPEAYKVVKELIVELDSEDIAELPMVVVLKYADAEELCDQLNALLNEQGTNATLRRSRRGLSPSSVSQDNGDNGNNNNNNNNNRNNNNEGGNQENVIRPWWTTGRQSESESPTSNLIGKIRFIPVHRSKAVLVLAPPEYNESIKEMIESLDQPGKQVLIKAVILQVDQNDLDSLGVKLSSNPLSFGDIGENAISALSQITASKSNIDIGGGVTGDYSFSGDITVLLDILKREANAKVLNQPALWTMDNEEAEFFKGEQIALRENERVTDQNNVISEFNYRNVGLTLRVRPNITPENSVNLTVSLEISTVKSELVNGNVAIDQLNTSTRMNAKDGETLMLGGVLFQSNTLIRTKTPILGDIPLLGSLFSHKRSELTNDELLVFITPTVVDSTNRFRENPEIEHSYELLDQTIQEMDAVKKKLGSL